MTARKVVKNRNRYLRPIRRLAFLLAGLAALLVSMTTGPAAFASSLRAEPQERP